MLAFGAAALPFLADACVALGFVPFPRAGLHFGATPFQIGLLGSAPQITFVATCLTVGGLSDRWGRRRAMMVGLLGYFLCFLVASRATSLTGLMAGALLLGAGGGLFWPSVEGAIGDAYGHGTLGRGLLLFNLGWTLGMTLGAWSGGLLSDLSLTLPFVVGMVASVIGLLLLFVWPPRGGHSHAASGPPPAPHKDAAHFLLLARIANFSAFFAVSCIRTLFTPLGTELGFNGDLIGKQVAIITLAQTVAFVALAVSRRWHYRLRPMLFAELALAVALVGTLWAASAGLFALLFGLVGAGCGVTYTASLFYSLDRSAGRGKMGAIHEAILGSGALAGPLLGGIVAESCGLRAPFLLAAVVMGIGLVAQVALRRAYTANAHA